MLKRLTVRNFQCHTALDQELSPGVNVFVGKSGAGKSAGVVRPMRLLAFNRPLGESYRRWGSDETEVLVELDDGREVSRTKGDKDNLYRLGEEEFRSFGQQPPEAVREALNLGEINFQFQHDPLFLLSMRAPELSRTLNEVAGLDQIDEAFSRVNSRLRRERQELATADALKIKHQELADKYKDLDQLEVQCRLAGELDSRRAQAKALGDRLADLAGRWTMAEASADRYAGLEEVEQLHTTISHIVEGIIENKAEHDALVDLADRWDGVLEELHRMKQLDRLDLVGSDLCLRSTKIQAADERRKGLLFLAYKMERAAAATEKAQEDLSATQQEFSKAMPRVCPLCGSIRKEEKL